MCNVFAEIKEQVSMQEAARFYGLQTDRRGMACCPFHNEKKPSLKVYDDHFYCFGCGATGDCTGFVAKLFGISQYEAARKISHDFGLRLFEREFAANIQSKPDPEREYRMWLIKAGQAVSDYLTRLYKWRRQYKPAKIGEQVNPLFTESLTKTNYVEYLSEVLTLGSEQEKRELFKSNRDSITQIQKRLAEIAARERPLKHKTIKNTGRTF